MAQVRNRKRKVSKQQQAVYRRRRIVVGVALVLIVALVVFCVYSIGRGISEVGQNMDARAASHVDISRQATPQPHRSTGIKNCDSSNVHMQLSAKASEVAVGGSLEWTETITHDGSKSCLIDVSDSSVVLTITSGSDTIWRSDSCPAESDLLLMAKGDRKIRTVTWNTNRTGQQCADDKDLPKIDKGTYVGQLTLKNDATVISDPVTIEVK